MKRRQAILLTGASGVVGQAVLRELAGRRPVISLVHRRRFTGSGTEVLPCDLSKRRCGLSEEDYRSIVSRIVGVVHAAALTEWGRPNSRYEAVNVEGTRHVIELATDASVPVHFLSTAFVGALPDFAPKPLRAGNVTAPYIRSKRAAELMLAESGLPHSIYRPTNLIGDSLTGWTTRPQIVQLVSDWVCWGRATIFPVPPGDLLDVMPQDLLAKIVVRALTMGETGREYWITRGARAMTMQTAVDILVEHARLHGRHITRPLLLHPKDVTREDLATQPPLSRMFMRIMMDVREVVAACGGVFPSSLDVVAARFGLMPLVPDVVAYRRTLWAAERATTRERVEAGTR